MQSKKKIFITGVSGFIGSKVAKQCLKNGFEVIGITRSNPKIIQQELNIDIIKFDLNDLIDLKLASAYAIIHCATPNDLVSKKATYGASLAVTGTSKILEAAQSAGIKNVVYLSTAQVYGTELNGYYDETSRIKCESHYAFNHYLGERLCKYYCNINNLNALILRPSNVFGIPEISTVNRKTLVPMCFVEEAIKNNTITLRSSGKQIRNFISTDELADGILENLMNFQKGYSIINCGSKFYASMLDMANLVTSLYRKKCSSGLAVNVQGLIPEKSNIFEYNSLYKFNKNLKSDTYKIMIKTIEGLLKLWEKK